MGRTVTIYPNSDIANAGNRVGAATFYGCVAQDPHDGDTSRIGSLSAGSDNIFGADWSGIEPDEIVTGIVVRWAESGGGTQDVAGRAGLRIGGTFFSGPARQISPGGGYLGSDEAFPVNPSTGLPWVTATLPSIALQHRQDSDPDVPSPGRPRLTQLVAIVSLDGPVDEAVGSSGAARAAAAGSAPSASAADSSPTAAAASGAPSASAAAAAPRASASGAPPWASGATGGPRATPAAPGTVSASATSGAPRASAASGAPTATASAPSAPRGAGE
jgi:hypothetical protein